MAWNSKRGNIDFDLLNGLTRLCHKLSRTACCIILFIVNIANKFLFDDFSFECMIAAGLC